MGRCVIVLISDGRANIPLATSVADPKTEAGAPAADAKAQTAEEKKAARNALKDEVIGVARQIGAMPQFKLLVIDTENKFVSTGMAKEIATAANGRYHYIPKASADAMSRIASDAVASLKSSQK